MDSLTSHIAHSHSHSHSHSHPNPNPIPRSPILRWLSSLAVPARQSALTFTDPAFARILLHMRAHLASSGPTLFFLHPDLPGGPSLCHCRARCLLGRTMSAADPTISGSLLLFGSRDECVLDSITVSEDLVGDVDGFVEVMDGVSNGRFLRGEEEGLWKEWKEMGWLKDKGYYSLEEFVANRLEVALRQSWGGGRGKKGKGKVERGGTAAWQERVCCGGRRVCGLGTGLEPGRRREFCTGFLGKAAESLAFADTLCWKMNYHSSRMLVNQVQPHHLVFFEKLFQVLIKRSEV